MNISEAWRSTVGLRALFYMVPPSESYEAISSENAYFYTFRAIPWFYLLIFLDCAIGQYRNKQTYDLRDSAGKNI